MAIHNDLGERGEALAIDYLLKKGYLVLEKNFRYLKAEVDIIAQKEGLIVAVEVKTRSGNYFGNPQEFVNPKKIRLLVSALDYYMTHYDIDSEVRFDIIAIIMNNKSPQIEHIEDAFLYF